MERVAGIDVSRWQGVIDWQAVVAAEAGYRFAFIRATIGDSYVDPRFHINWAGASAAGLLISAYHVIKPNVSAQKQVAHFFDVLDGREADLPLVVDVERNDGQNASAVSRCVAECVKLIETQSGRAPIIYTAAWCWNKFTRQAAFWKAYDLWVASYTSQPRMPRDWDTWKFWQYSESGNVSGINTRKTDLNWFMGTEEDLLAYANQHDTSVVRKLRARVNVRKLNVRNGPGLDYDDIGDLYKGDVVEFSVIRGKDVWFQIADGQWVTLGDDTELYLELDTES